MTVIAVMMVRDEADVIGHTLAHLLASGVDHVIVSDNLSTDDTRDIAELYAERYPVTVLDDPDPAYEQAAKMTRLSACAWGMGADWVLPVDADEIVYDPAGDPLDVFFDSCGADIVEITGFDHIATDSDDADWDNPFLRIRHRRATPQRLPKVAFRAHPDAEVEMGNHGVKHPGGDRAGGLELRHFQYRTLPQAIRKLRQGAAAYAATDPTSFVGGNYRRGHFGTHWAQGAACSDDELAAWWVDLTNEQGLIVDPAPVRCL